MTSAKASTSMLPIGVLPLCVQNSPGSGGLKISRTCSQAVNFRRFSAWFGIAYGALAPLEAKAMQRWHGTYLGLREIPRELSEFELQAFFTFSGTERACIQRRRGPALELGLALHLGSCA